MQKEDFFVLKGNFDSNSTIEKKAEDTTTDSPFLGYVEGYASTSALDREDDIITGKALENASGDLLKHNKVFFNHQHEDIPIGLVVKSEYHATKEGVFVKAGITSAVHWDAISKGLLDNFSVFGRFGDAKVKDEDIDGKKKKIREIKQVNFFEVSVVGMPANADAHFTSVIAKYFGQIGETNMPNTNEDNKITETVTPAVAPVTPGVSEETVNKQINELKTEFAVQMSGITDVIKAAMAPKAEAPVIAPAPAPAVTAPLPQTERKSFPSATAGQAEYTTAREVEDEQLRVFAKAFQHKDPIYIDMYGSKINKIPKGMGTLGRGDED